MIRCNTLASLEGALKDIEVGEVVLVNVKTLMVAFAKGLFKNKKNNRKASDSPWNKENFQNYSDNIEEEVNIFLSKKNTDTYFGTMEFIDFVITEDGFELNDGAHRKDYFLRIFNFDIPTKFRDSLRTDSLLNNLIDEQATGAYSAETERIFENCFIPVRCLNDFAKRYVGKNSSKTMKSQQKNRVLYSGNALHDGIAEIVENATFSLCAINASKEETSVLDTISFLGYLGGDHKASRTATGPYILDKYSEKKSQNRLISLGNQLIDTMQMHYLDEFSFVFNGWQFKSAYMSGLLMLVKEYSISKVCKKYNLTAKTLRTQILKDENMFFEVLETSLNLLNNKKFLKSLNSATTKKNIDNVRIDSNGTGSFSTGSAIYSALIATVKNPLL